MSSCSKLQQDGRHLGRMPGALFTKQFIHTLMFQTAADLSTPVAGGRSPLKMTILF